MHISKRDKGPMRQWIMGYLLDGTSGMCRPGSHVTIVSALLYAAGVFGSAPSRAPAVVAHGHLSLARSLSLPSSTQSVTPSSPESAPGALLR